MISKYLSKNFYKYFLLNMLVLVGIIWLTRIIRYLDFVTDKNMHIYDFLSLILLLLPMLGEVLLPVITFIAVIFSYNYFTKTKEIYIIKVAGISRLKILQIYGKATFYIVFFNYVLSFYLVPYSNKLINNLKLKLANQIIITSVEAGKFNKISPDLTVYIDEKEGNMLKNIIIYQLKSDQQQVLTTAKKGEIVRDHENLLLALADGSHIITSQHKYGEEFLTFDKYITDLNIFSELNVIKKPTNQLKDLYINELIMRKNENNELRAEMHHRIIWPLLSFILISLVLTILMNGEYNRNSNLRKIMMALLSAMLVFILYFILKERFATRIELVFATYLAIISFFSSLIFINYRSRIR